MKIGISFSKIRGYLLLNIGVFESFFFKSALNRSFKVGIYFRKSEFHLNFRPRIEAVRFFLPRRSIDLESNYKTLNSRHFYFT